MLIKEINKCKYILYRVLENRTGRERDGFMDVDGAQKTIKQKKA